jgi:hypothetical protein
LLLRLGEDGAASVGVGGFGFGCWVGGLGFGAGGGGGAGRVAPDEVVVVVGVLGGGWNTSGTPQYSTLPRGGGAPRDQLRPVSRQRRIEKPMVIYHRR